MAAEVGFGRGLGRSESERGARYPLETGVRKTSNLCHEIPFVKVNKMEATSEQQSLIATPSEFTAIGLPLTSLIWPSKPSRKP
jgi:hypothetical protein